MFGHSQRKRERKKNKKAKQELAAEKATWEATKPEREKESSDFKDQQIADKTAKSKAERKTSREEGIKYGSEFLNRPMEGLDPATKSALQYEASNNIDRSMQNANRQLLGDQGMRGITGKSGVAYAQQRDLQKLGQEAQGQATRDLTKMDRALALKKQAALLNLQEGEVSQDMLDKQKAKEELELDDQKKWQKELSDKLNQYFTRV